MPREKKQNGNIKSQYKHFKRISEKCEPKPQKKRKKNEKMKKKKGHGERN